jgi:hypothetical protein
MQTRYENKYGKNHVLFSNPVMKPLKQVKPDDVLFIGAHGSKSREEVAIVTGKTAIGVTRTEKVNPSNNLKVYETVTEYQDIKRWFTPNDLAELLKSDGLTRTQRFVLLNSCYACGTLFPDKFLATDPFAKLLAVAMGKKGFKKVVVGGHQGIYHITPEIDVPCTVQNSDKSTELRAKGRRRYFSTNGSQILGVELPTIDK